MNHYHCWLQYRPMTNQSLRQSYQQWLRCVSLPGGHPSPLLQSIRDELNRGIGAMLQMPVDFVEGSSPQNYLTVIGKPNQPLVRECLGPKLVEDLYQMKDEAYCIRTVAQAEGGRIVITGHTDRALLYGVFHLLRLMQMNEPLEQLDIRETPRNPLRMLNHWDNMDGSVERGYAGSSIFYEHGRITTNEQRIRDYARLLASVGINSIAINNVNVHETETKLITPAFLPDVAKIAGIFRSYGIQIFLSINFASPVELGDLDTADPLDSAVRQWWKERAKDIYQYIPDFGGFLVKADSEHRPGPFTYNRTHVDGANMLAEALHPFGGIVIWRCFVYNCMQDWRDRQTDRAKAAYDHFQPLDGKFLDNVILQIKNGPMDFQVREPVSPLFGAMEQTNQMMEFQITQEYTGQQRHLCYLVPQWKEVLDFDTYAKGEGSTVKRIVDGSLYGFKHSGIAGVANVGSDENWTGHTLAQANLYGFGRLTWNPDLSAEQITEEWIRLTFGPDPQVIETIAHMLLSSWRIYENYTAPLGVGWMVNPGHHYGPNVDGYEYSRWGTYHYADCFGIGVDRTMKTGTGYTAQYFSPNREMYESLDTCPDEYLLFFHHVPYTHRLKSGETVIQHIYNTHFEGVEQVKGLIEKWKRLEGKFNQQTFDHVLSRLMEQLEHVKEWRDVINTYFYRKSGIPDEKNRTIY
ncbi:alpha-glucuronidase [Caldalkalibacillus uzonensis]|uniref:Xylan alpha-1,2-glucuronidase n=1 Tax=Caldalkalibacillus uzonensis TaxID=353224 RepID=A0ABU0CRB9_9BACI|nr:alpha-glucuronidase family glycosyl hydrolase [Caldalkalibacillus uzonensis]MDQ0338613.1 alpha-glucuronidase [Caldalkalibacillus uzonensis]